MPDASRESAAPDPVGLALALCHEVGNLVGAVRLHTHLIDEDMTRRELARVTLEVDDLCARSAALLAHVRPLLAATPSEPEAVSPRELLESVHDVVAEQGGPRVRLDTARVADGPDVRIDREVLHHALQSLLFTALEAAGSSGTVALLGEPTPEGVALVVEDDGAVRDDPADYRAQVRRGRPLLLAVVEAILRPRGGALEVARVGGRTRVALRLPAVSTAP